ncbi:derepression protein [Escherichia coli]|uniref:Derepression protein n=1 Tax=Escherichia coli TaxID=562 RepID=A0A376W403_ECOLX|nr:derepression protein [Escherichia coli]
MANRKQQRARAERLHIRSEINRRLFRATRVAQIMHITCCMSARTRCQTVTALLSSAISPKIWQNCKASSTSTDKPHPEAIPHLHAGGFRTSVTGGSHEER